MSRMEALALAYVTTTTGVEWHRMKWRDGFRDFIRECCDDDPAEAWAGFRAMGSFMPDGWCRNPSETEVRGGSFNVLEVEDTSRMTEAKLEFYSEVWFWVDCWALGYFRLWTTDRYGRDLKEISLMDHWYARKAVGE